MTSLCPRLPVGRGATRAVARSAGRCHLPLPDRYEAGPVLRRPPTLASAVSLVLCVATLILRVRSRLVADTISVGRR